MFLAGNHFKYKTKLRKKYAKKIMWERKKLFCITKVSLQVVEDLFSALLWEKKCCPKKSIMHGQVKTCTAAIAALCGEYVCMWASRHINLFLGCLLACISRRTDTCETTSKPQSFYSARGIYWMSHSLSSEKIHGKFHFVCCNVQ